MGEQSSILSYLSFRSACATGLTWKESLKPSSQADSSIQRPENSGFDAAQKGCTNADAPSFVHRFTHPSAGKQQQRGRSNHGAAVIQQRRSDRCRGLLRRRCLGRRRPATGHRILDGRYEILQALGEGGMGTVYKARDRKLDHLVALKVIRPDLARNPAIIQRFKQELILARQVTHRNVVRIFDLGEADGIKFITMEVIVGMDPRSLLSERHATTLHFFDENDGQANGRWGSAGLSRLYPCPGRWQARTQGIFADLLSDIDNLRAIQVLHTA